MILFQYKCTRCMEKGTREYPSAKGKLMTMIPMYSNQTFSGENLSWFMDLPKTRISIYLFSIYLF